MSDFVSPSGLRPAMGFLMSRASPRHQDAPPSEEHSSSGDSPSAAADEGGQLRRPQSKRLPEEVAAAVASALLPRMEDLGQCNSKLDPAAFAQAVAAKLAPEFQKHAPAVASAVVEALFPHLDEVLRAVATATAAPAATTPQWVERQWVERPQDMFMRPPSTNNCPDEAVLSQAAEQPSHGVTGAPTTPCNDSVPADGPCGDQGQAEGNAVSGLVSTVGGLPRRPACPALGRSLSRAFVVNFRRLMDLEKVLAILHELIKSTAIAALTLVKAGNAWQLGYSVMFVAILLCLYGLHFVHYDNLDIGDYRRLAELLEDDSGHWDGRHVSNPNRLLKALTLSRRGRRRRAILAIVGFALLCLAMWSMLFVQWSLGVKWGAEYMEILDAEFYATLLLVGTAMLLFHIAFEWIYWRETQGVMPGSSEDRSAWDPRRQGVPRAYAWFGLPSMWFTSLEAQAALRLWIAHAKELRGHERARKIFPEEMAIFALDPQGCRHLRNALLHSKLYSMHEKAFLKVQHGDPEHPRQIRHNEEPEELNMDLLFFDNQSNEYSLPEEDYQQGQVHLLRRGNSLESDCGSRQWSKGTEYIFRQRSKARSECLSSITSSFSFNAHNACLHESI